MPKVTALALGAAFAAIGIVMLVAMDNLWLGVAFLGLSTIFDLLFVKAVVDETRARQRESR